MLAVSHLTYTYPGTTDPAIHDLNFSIQHGEIFGFLGPSGSGKSTTQKILYKLLKGYSGSVRIGEKDLGSWDQSFYSFIGVGFELPNHYLKLTALENLRFFASFYPGENPDLMALMASVGLEADAHKAVGEYSKGMKMRLNFLRAIMHNPQFVFLDEPTSGLDPVNAQVIKRLIRALRDSGKTIFLTTHNMLDAEQLCDRVALLNKGQIQVIDSPASLKLRYGQRKVSVLAAGDSSQREYPLDALGSNQEFMALLQENRIHTIHSQEATLEDVFIKLTGQQLL